MGDAVPHCPDCGAELQLGANDCWLCKRPITAATSRPSACQTIPGSAAPLQFTLASLFVFTTLVAVALGVFLLAPGLGIAIIVALGPALVREFGIAGMWRKTGRPLNAWEHGLSLLGSLALVLAIGVSSAGAFLAVCFPLGAISFGYPSGGSQLGFFLAWVLGIVAGLFSGGLVFYYLWLHWHFRFRRDAKPPTLKERAVAVLHFAVVHVAPLLLAYGLAWLVVAWIQSHTTLGPRPTNENALIYVATTITFIGAWGLMILHRRAHFRSFTLLMAIAIGAAGGPLIPWVPWFIEQGFVDWLSFWSSYGWSAAVVGGLVGLAVAWHWPVPNLNQ